MDGFVLFGTKSGCNSRRVTTKRMARFYNGMAIGYASTSNAVNLENTILLPSLHFGGFVRFGTKRNDTGASYAVTTQQTGKQLDTINRQRKARQTFSNFIEPSGWLVG